MSNKKQNFDISIVPVTNEKVETKSIVFIAPVYPYPHQDSHTTHIIWDKLPQKKE